MRVKITQPVQAESLKNALQAKFPQYKVYMRNKSIIVIQKSGSVGTTILVGSKSLAINGNFPTMGGSMLFALCCVLLGFLIPLIVYFAAFHGKMKVVEKEVVAFVEQEYLKPVTVAA
jgi:hypothetical protein